LPPRRVFISEDKISGISLAIEPTWLASNPGYKLKFSSNVHVSEDE